MDIRVEICCLLLFGLMLYRAEGRNEMNIVQFTNIEKSTINESCTIDSGTIPSWLQGYLIRQSCAAFGETGKPKVGNLTNSITHLFDCIPAGTSFRINEGDASFFNRFYDTVTHDIWKSYNYDMTKSGVWFKTIFATYDLEQVQKHSINYTSTDKLGGVPHVTWWTHEKAVSAVSEYPSAVEVDIHTMEAVGPYPFKDKNLGLPENAFPSSQPAHEQEEPDGMLWSTVSVYRTNSDTNTAEVSQAVYTVKDSFRKIVAEYKWADVDFNKCTGGDYPAMEQLGGYMHSFAMTENYIVLPVTSSIEDPCHAFVYNKEGPRYPTAYKFRKDIESKFLIFRKADRNFVARVQVPSMFVTHQLNSYERDGKLHLDMLAYNDSRVYTHFTYIETLLEEEIWDCYPTRFVIDTATWRLTERRLLLEEGSLPLEFSTINNKYNAKPYKYGYIVHRPYISNTSILKLNVDSGEYLNYPAPNGLYPSEPIFVPFPGAKAEDDGILLIQGVDAIQKKGFLIILDARTMKQTAKITAPALALSGLHNKFYPLEFGMNAEFTTGNAERDILSFFVLVLSLLGVIHFY